VINNPPYWRTIFYDKKALTLFSNFNRRWNNH